MLCHSVVITSISQKKIPRCKYCLEPSGEGRHFCTTCKVFTNLNRLWVSKSNKIDTHIFQSGVCFCDRYELGVCTGLTGDRSMTLYKYELSMKLQEWMKNKCKAINYLNRISSILIYLLGRVLCADIYWSTLLVACCYRLLTYFFIYKVVIGTFVTFRG